MALAFLLSADVPGVNLRVGESMKSPSSYEYATGVSRAFSRGSVRVDYVYRDYKYIRRWFLIFELTATASFGVVFILQPQSITGCRNVAAVTAGLYFVYTAIINVMQFPATQVPLGLSSEGLPLGVQVVAGPGRDHVCIAVAQELERQFGGWVPPA